MTTMTPDAFVRPPSVDVSNTPLAVDTTGGIYASRVEVLPTGDALAIWSH